MADPLAFDVERRLAEVIWEFTMADALQRAALFAAIGNGAGSRVVIQFLGGGLSYWMERRRREVMPDLPATIDWPRVKRELRGIVLADPRVQEILTGDVDVEIVDIPQDFRSN